MLTDFIMNSVSVRLDQALMLVEQFDSSGLRQEVGSCFGDAPSPSFEATTV